MTDISQLYREAGQALIRLGEALAAQPQTGSVARTFTVDEQRHGEEMSAVIIGPARFEAALTPWCVRLRAIVGAKMSANSQPQWQRLHDLYGDLLLEAAAAVPAPDRWADRVEAECASRSRAKSDAASARIEAERRAQAAAGAEELRRQSAERWAKLKAERDQPKTQETQHG